MRLDRLVKVILLALDPLPEVTAGLSRAAPIAGLAFAGLIPLLIGLFTGVVPGVVAALSVSSLLLLVAGYRLQGHIDEYEESKPRIEFVRCYTDLRALFSGGMPLAAKVHFAHAVFRNNPQSRVAAAVAKGVVGEIRFYSADGAAELLGAEVFGRWGKDTAQPGTLGPFEPKSHLYGIDLDVNGLPHELDLAMKYREDSCAYAFDNDHFADRFEPYKIEAPVCRIRVHLRGEGVDSEFWFRLEWARDSMTITEGCGSG